MTNLLGITGPAGHGKNTVGDLLQKHLPMSLPTYAFADPIKTLVHSAFKAPVGWETREGKEMEQEFTVHYWELHDLISGGELVPHIEPHMSLTEATAALEDVLEQNLPHAEAGFDFMVFRTSWRQLYQLFGTEWGRQRIHMDFWINMAPTKHHIITDVRGQGDHPVNKNTEALHVINHGGLVLEVVDPRKAVAQCREHSSEVGIDAEHICYTIVNDGSLKDLERKAMDFLYTHILKEEI